MALDFLASITKTSGINMTALSKVMRPLVEFDVNNAEHRRLYFNFVKNSSWKDCPYRFKAKGYGNTKGTIDRKLLEFYISNEFSQPQNIIADY